MRLLSMRSIARVAAIATALGVAPLARATIVDVTNPGQWYAFDVDDLGSASGGVEWIDTGPAGFGTPLTFRFTLVAPTLLDVVDGGFAGDRFDVRITAGAATTTLRTGIAANSFPASVGTDFARAFATPAYSSLSTLLGPGTYTVTGSLAQSSGGGAPLNATVGAIALRRLPEPPSLALAALGFLGIGFAATRRRARGGIACAALAAIATLGLAGHATAQVDTPLVVKIIGFNDYHGNVQSPGTFSATTQGSTGTGAVAAGGADYLAGWVAKLKAQNPLNVVVGAGDFIGATPLVSSLFFDEPAIETLNRIGLEFNAVGNHEFDRGARELQRLQSGGCKLDAAGNPEPNSCRGALVGTPVPFEGAKFRWLAANVIQTATGRPLLPAYGIKTFEGVRMAFIGMTLRETPTIVTPSGVAGLEFRDEADTVNALVPRLRALGVEAIVVLVHQGGFQSPGGDINACNGSLPGAAIAPIVARFSDAVDLVVTGHTHTAYNCRLPNSVGRLVPVTQASAFGRVISDIDVTIDRTTRDIVAVGATNRVVDRTDPAVTPNAEIRNLVAGYESLVSPIANQVIGSITADLPNTAIDAACNMPAGDLIADAQLAATAPASFGGAVIAFMNRGGVRSPGFTFASSTAGEGAGNVTYGEAFTVQPFGNSLVTMTVTAQDLKDVLEQQFAGCRGQSATATRVMLPSAGFRYTWDGSRACDARVSNVTLTRGGVAETIVDANGAVVDPAKTYRITVNNFMATGGDGYTTFLRGTSLLGGAQDIDALVAYLAGFKAPAPAYDATAAALAKPRIARVGGTSCPTGANVNP